MNHYNMTQKQAHELLSKALESTSSIDARLEVAAVAQWLYNLIAKKNSTNEQKCPECKRGMQLLYTMSSQTDQTARVGYLCPHCDIVVLDEWSNGEDAVLSRIVKIVEKGSTTEILHATTCPNCGHETEKRGCVIISWGIKIVVLCGTEDKAIFYRSEEQ